MRPVHLHAKQCLLSQVQLGVGFRLHANTDVDTLLCVATTVNVDSLNSGRHSWGGQAVPSKKCTQCIRNPHAICPDIWHTELQGTLVWWKQYTSTAPAGQAWSNGTLTHVVSGTQALDCSSNAVIWAAHSHRGCGSLLLCIQEQGQCQYCCGSGLANGWEADLLVQST